MRTCTVYRQFTDMRTCGLHMRTPQRLCELCTCARSSAHQIPAHLHFRHARLPMRHMRTCVISAAVLPPSPAPPISHRYHTDITPISHRYHTASHTDITPRITPDHTAWTGDWNVKDQTGALALLCFLVSSCSSSSLSCLRLSVLDLACPLTATRTILAARMLSSAQVRTLCSFFLAMFVPHPPLFKYRFRQQL
jgi:hypothetical protein